jgi:hypothetical protein
MPKKQPKFAAITFPTKAVALPEEIAILRTLRAPRALRDSRGKNMSHQDASHSEPTPIDLVIEDIEGDLVDASDLAHLLKARLRRVESELSRLEETGMFRARLEDPKTEDERTCDRLSSEAEALTNAIKALRDVTRDA